MKVDTKEVNPAFQRRSLSFMAVKQFLYFAQMTHCQ